ncbi:MAG: 4Fe-4S dicluster domain-containing protein [Dehalococcoidia bacterium]|nr:4Fe-4S dicluster domain-containing protein [Dehalococcoidia bacterium]
MKGNNSFVDEVYALPGGEGVRLCIQCGTCSGSCPNANKMDYTPRELIAMARAGMRDEVLSSNSMWLCLSCYLCTVRCPRGIKITELMHALECLSSGSGMSTKRVLTPKLYKTFTDIVYKMGMVPEFILMVFYYLRTNLLSAIKMIPMALSLLRHGRLDMKPHRLKPESQRQLKAILDKARTLGGRP